MELAGSGGMGGRTTGLRLVCRREQAPSKETWMLDGRDAIDSEEVRKDFSGGLGGPEG